MVPTRGLKRSSKFRNYTHTLSEPRFSALLTREPRRWSWCWSRGQVVVTCSRNGAQGVFSDGQPTRNR
jgi:hypothetical protein